MGEDGIPMSEIVAVVVFAAGLLMVCAGALLP